MRVDCSGESYLPICGQCSWRGLPRSTRRLASIAYEQHAIDIHNSTSAKKSSKKRAERER